MMLFMCLTPHKQTRAWPWPCPHHGNIGNLIFGCFGWAVYAPWGCFMVIWTLCSSIQVKCRLTARVDPAGDLASLCVFVFFFAFSLNRPRDHPSRCLYYAGIFWLYLRLQSHCRLRNVTLACVFMCV